jgi:uncharacterized Fe-S cluster-containing MiaB family protein
MESFCVNQKNRILNILQILYSYINKNSMFEKILTIINILKRQNFVVKIKNYLLLKLDLSLSLKNRNKT